jgi:hypothetical protein
LVVGADATELDQVRKIGRCHARSIAAA